MREYVVVYERDDAGGWDADLPGLSGVVALGATRDEVSDRIREAVGAYAEEIGALGQHLPIPVAATGTIQVVCSHDADADVGEGLLLVHKSGSIAPRRGFDALELSLPSQFLAA